MTGASATLASVEEDRRGRLVLAAGLALGVLVVAVARLALFGWGDVAPDDARYVFVGLSTLDGHGPVTPSGNLFLLRSPVYGIALAAGRWLTADGPVGGARIVAAALTIAAMIGAIWLGWSLAGFLGALGTALALLSMTLIWRLLPTLRVDLPQSAGVIAVLLALRRPTVRRWALAGALLGVTVLVKETILLLALAPLALAGSLARARFVRLWAIFLASAGVVAGWWWIVVWTQSGTIFPLNAIGVIERRDVGADLRLDSFGLGLVVGIAASWLVAVIVARREREVRLLVAAAACLVPPAAYAMANGLNTRNLAGLAVLSAVTVGVTCGQIGRVMASLAPARLGGAGRAAALVIAVVGLLGAAAGQARVGDPGESALPHQMSTWLLANARPGSQAVMTFRDSEIVALELYGQIAVPGLAAVRVSADAALSDFLWIGLRDRQLFGYTRAGWEQTLTGRGIEHLILAGPHPLTPAELMPALDGGGVPGVTFARQFTAGDEWASIYDVATVFIQAGPGDVALHLSPAAALAWLDLTAGRGAPAAAQRLVAAAPLIVGSDTDQLKARLAGVGCLVAAPSDGPESSRITAVGSGCTTAG